MSGGGYQTLSISTPTAPITPSNGLENSSSDPDINSAQDSSRLDASMLIKSENSPEAAVGSPGFVMDHTHTQSQTAVLSQSIDTDYNSNSFNFSYDGSFSLSPQQSVDMKDLEKADAASVILSNQPLSNSSLSAGSNASPKSFMALSINETKNDKMISGFDGRVDGLSPLSVIAVSAYQDVGHSSPNVPSSILSRTHVLRYHPGSDTMLSALNYNESDMLQEGGFDVPSSHNFSTLDGLLSSASAPGMRLPDLLDGDINQETYIEAGQELQLSPHNFPKMGDSFAIRESSPLTGLTGDNSQIKTEIKSKVIESTSNTLGLDKLKVKGARPVKATSPNRPGTQPCPTCGKVFSNSSALTKHKLTHSDERKYVCQLCAKAFKRQDHLNGHMLTHRNKKPFECDAEGCGKSYCDARSLRRHKENHHSSTSSANIAASLNSQVSVIPGLAHLGFNSLQNSFPASVITSSSASAFTESSLGNRIQYAPPPTTTSLSGRVTSASSDNLTRTVSNTVVSSVIPTAASHLQFLTFQQQPSSKAQQQVVSSSPKNVSRSDTNTVLTSWQPQTINTGALLLAQNFGASQSINQSQTTQLITRSFESSTAEQGNSSGSELSQSQLLNQRQESKETDGLSQDSREQNALEQPVLSETCFEVVNSSSGTKQIVALTSQGSVNLQFGSDSNTVVRLQDSTGDSLYARSSVQIVKIETSDQSNTSSVPTTPTTKEPSNCTQLGSPLLQQLLNQQQSVEVSNAAAAAVTSGSEQSFLSSLQEQQKQSTSQQSSVLISPWSQSTFYSQDPKPVECSLCQRKFKNIPALNGHMRLHGGYFKKENESKKSDKKGSSTSHNPPLQTASTNVRALIEEKINQKRNFMPQTSVQNNVLDNSQPQAQTFTFQASQLTNEPPPTTNFISHVSPILSPIAQETPSFNNFVSSQSSDLDSLTDNFSAETCDILKKLDFKEHFRVPHPPAEKHRRHSDSDHFIHPKRPCTSFTSSALADLLRSRVVAKRTSRTGSDPGEPLSIDAQTFPSISDSLSSVNDLPKFTSLVSSSLSGAMVDDTSSEMHQHGLTAITPEDAALPILSAEDIPEVQPMMMGIRDISDLDAQCLERNVFFDNSNNDLGVEQSFPEISVSELEMMQFASVVTTSAPMSSEVKPVNGTKMRNGDDSNDDDVFLSPTSLPTSPLKLKKKRRPEPLYIPPYVNTCGFTSRLRSPRLWDPSNPDHKKLSPPPYTPPPMLSPVRSGSGLFWHILSGSGSLTPKSAPITPSFNLGHKGSVGESTPETEEESIEAPESDIHPHVNIGSNYQAKIPQFSHNFKDALLVEHKADKVWDPSTLDGISEEEVDSYLELACCAVVPGGGQNKEFALHLLQLCKGNIKDAVLNLMNSGLKLPPNHPLLTYQYCENDRWSPEEIETYHQGLLRCDKDFFNIAKDISTKTVKQCIQFYYLWKKVCPDEYKRLRLIRRRKEQESLYYNLRSKEESQDDEEKSLKHSSSPPCSTTRKAAIEDAPENVSINGSLPTDKCTTKSSGHGNSPAVTTSTYNGSNLSSAYDFPIEPLEEFPCKICGKIFSKVKSRSAHMKSHRQQDSDKKNRYEC
ncbi:uncharacterized protein LOC129224210 [Uloborus diversus]|uniref:uncharacterized protein LOC129224210 n=1 Tax=Uloborus diversus TaxID=327109 RepID=UPI00240A49B9|nr:uncharacterized protein LOC129224210 [Uloborus diversus]